MKFTKKSVVSLIVLVSILLLPHTIVFAGSVDITTVYRNLAVDDLTFIQPILPNYHAPVTGGFTEGSETFSYATVNIMASETATYVMKVLDARLTEHYGYVFFEDPEGLLSYDDLPEGYPVYSENNIISANYLGDVGFTYSAPLEETNYTILTQGDSLLLLYEAPFDPEHPLTNLLAADDDYTNPEVWGWPFSYIEYELKADQKYVLVVSTWSAGYTGEIDLSITGPGEIVISEDEIDNDLPTPANVKKIPQKRDPITNKSETASTDDLSYLVAIPEQWMADVTYVEFWLDAAPVTSQSEGYDFISTAQSALKSVGSQLLDTVQVDLMQRVTRSDGSVTTGKVSPDAIRGNFTIRLPIPTGLAATPNLGIVYIESTGLTANLPSKIVTFDGTDYIEFQNNQPSAVYGFVS